MRGGLGSRMEEDDEEGDNAETQARVVAGNI